MGEGRWQARPCTCDPGPEGQHTRWCGFMVDEGDAGKWDADTSSAVGYGGHIHSPELYCTSVCPMWPHGWGNQRDQAASTWTMPPEPWVEELRERFVTELREGKVKLITGDGATELHIPERVPVTLDWGDQIGEATVRVDEDGVHFTCYLTPSGRVREALEVADSVSFTVPEDKLTPLGREVLGLDDDDQPLSGEGFPEGWPGDTGKQ